MGFEKQTLYIYKNGKNEGAFLDLVRIFDDYESLSYTKGFTAPGDFQITLNQATLGSEEFKVKRIIRIGDDDSKSVIIQSIKKTMDDHGNVIMTVSGQELWSVLGKRPVIPPTGQAYYDTATSTPVETGIKTMISQNCGTLATASRKFAALSILADQARGPGYKFSERYSNLLESVSKALISTSSGMQCILNHTSKKFELEWSAGTDRTTTVILSSDFDTAQNATMTETDLSYRNLILIAGQGEGVDRNVRTVYSGTEPTDLDRNEIFQDARDLSVNASLDARAAQKLEEYGYTKQISVNPLIYSNIRYERDYFVGDFVTFREFGITQSVWITAANESWVNGTYTLSLSVDKQPATVSSQIQALNSLFSQTAATVDPVLPSSSFLLLAGRSGGQSAYGGINASDNLTLSSTSHATKGKIKFGNSVYDEVNNRLLVGSDSSIFKFQVYESNNLARFLTSYDSDQAIDIKAIQTSVLNGYFSLDLSSNLIGWKNLVIPVGNVSIGTTNQISLVTIGGEVSPSTHNAYDLGTTAVRWKDLWLQSGAFNGSDARLKTGVRQFTKDEIIAAKQLSKEIGFYKWLDSIERKGELARSHCGLTVQKAIEIMKNNGLNPFDYGFIGYDQWDDKIVHHDEIKAVEAKQAVFDDEGNVLEKAVDPIEYKPEWDEVVIKAGDAYSFRYDQLNLFIARGIEERLSALENMSNIV